MAKKFKGFVFGTAIPDGPGFYYGGGGGSVPAPLPKISNLWDLVSTSYATLASGAAWGDSITRNNQAATMVANGDPFSAYTQLNYAPVGDLDVVSHGRWPDEIGLIVGSFTNQGVPGETSSQILTRMQSGSPSAVDMVSWGTNDGVSSIADQQLLMDNLNAAVTSGYLKSTTIVSQYNVRGSASSDGIFAWARSEGFKTFDWWAAMLKLAHRAETASTDLPANWIDGTQINAFLSQGTPTGGLDITHPGSFFSEAISREAAAMVSAIGASDAPPYMHLQNMAVDWSVPAGTAIGAIDVEGVVTASFINNDHGHTDAITIDGTTVMRGHGPAPSSKWADFFIEVRNTHGSGFNRLSLGDATGATKFGQTTTQLNHYLTSTATSGTISIVGKQTTSSTSRYIFIGDWEIQIRANGDLWFKGPFSSNVIFGGNVGDVQHWMVTWNATDCYTVLGTTYTDRTSIFTGATVGGEFRLFGSNGPPSLVVADIFETHHVYVSDQYFGPGTDLSPIWSGSGTNISGPSDVLSGDSPLYSCAGGPGMFATVNWGSEGAPAYRHHWDASNATLR